MSDGIVILNDGRIANFAFYQKDENPEANGLNGECGKFDRQAPNFLMDIMKKKELLPYNDEEKQSLHVKTIDVTIVETRQRHIKL